MAFYFIVGRNRTETLSRETKCWLSTQENKKLLRNQCQPLVFNGAATIGRQPQTLSNRLHCRLIDFSVAEGKNLLGF